MKTLVAAGAALAIGVCLGFLLGFHQQVEPPTPATPEPARTPPANEHSEPLSEQDVEHHVPDLPDQVEAPSKSAEFELPDIPSGEGRIIGQVRLTNGLPCVGLELRATPVIRTAMSLDMRRRLSPEERGNYEKAVALWEQEASREATTDESGNFEFERLGDHYHSIYCSQPGWHIRSARGQSQVGASPGDELSLVAIRLVKLPLTVRLPDGSEPQRVHVRIRSLEANAYEFAYWKPDNRVLDAFPGKVSVSTSGGPNNDLEGETTVDIPSEGEAPEVVLELKRPAGFYLKLEVPDLYYSELRVALLPAEDAESRQWHDTPWMSRSAKPVRKLSNREWFFPAAPEGNYVAYVGVEHQVVLESVEVRVTPGISEHTFKLPPLDLSDHFTVLTVDDKGEPVPNVRLSCTLADSEVAVGDMVACIEVETGKYLMRRPAIARDRFDRFVPTRGKDIAVQAVRGQTKRFGRLPADGQEVTIQFGASCTLIVEIENLPDEGRNDMWVAAIPRAASMRREAGMLRYSSNQYVAGSKVALTATREFTDLQPGPAMVAVYRDGSSSGSGDESTLVSTELTLVEGAQTVRLTMPPLYSLEVRTTEDQKVRVLYVEGQSIQLTKRTDENGRLRLHSLPAGEYQVGNSTSGYMKVSVPVPEGVDFSPLPHNCMCMASYDHAGALYSNGMRTGDLIVAINGEYFEDKETMQTAWQAAQENPSVRLEIDRDGQILYVTLTGEELKAALKKEARFSYRRR